MATARIMMSANPRPNVHHWPTALVPLTALPALIRPLLLVTAPSTASVGPTARTAKERAQKAAPIMAETAAERLLKAATAGRRMRLIQTESLPKLGMADALIYIIIAKRIFTRNAISMT